MKKVNKIALTVYCLLFTVYCLQAQSNLVPNPSFEFYSHCPTNGGDSIFLSTPWTGPTYNSTDYFNSCVTGTHGSLPFSLNYYPRTGNAMAGFWAAFNSPNYREYLQSSLTSSLLSGKCYYISFYVSFVDNYSEVAVNNIGANLSNITYPTNLSFPGNVLNVSYHALKFNNPIIADTLKWVQITGIYVATGGENTILIGDFKDDAHTDSLNLVANPHIPAYYLLDDVSVIPTDSISMPPYAGRDTTITLGDSVFIGQQLYGLNCNWYCNNVLINTNISGIWVKPTITTKYVVEQNLCGNTDYDTVTVSISTVGIKKYSFRDNTTIYPNPNAGKELFITPVGLTNGSLQIKLTDLEGRVVYENTCTVADGLSNLKITDITNGVYFVHITNTITGEKVIKKLVIQY